MPVLQIPDTAVKGEQNLNPVTLYPRPPKKLWLEIGFGNGEHLTGLLQRDRDTAFIGAEPFLNGMSAFLKSIRDLPQTHNRIRVWMEDGRDLAESLTDACLDGIYVLNPDPWPKKRHHKRRIITHENLDTFARILKPGGELVMTTDVDDLAEWMVTVASTHPAFVWTAQSQEDWRTAPVGWISTRYEQKGIAAGRRQTYLIFRRTES